MFTPLSIIEVTKTDVQKGSQKPSKLMSTQIYNLVWVDSTILFPTKIENELCMISEWYRNLNKQLKHQTYPMPKIREMPLKLEGFEYATPLELNMVYYHIPLSK